MKPLLYVSYKTVYNGIKRTVRTPTRLIGAIAIIAYWMMLIITRGFGGGRELPKGFGAPQFNLPASDLLFAIAFAAMTFGFLGFGENLSNDFSGAFELFAYFGAALVAWLVVSADESAAARAAASSEQRK